MKPEFKLLLNFENWQEIYNKKSPEQLQEDVKALHEMINTAFTKDVIFFNFRK